MTPYERWHAIMNSRPTDRLVTDISGTGEIMGALRAHLGAGTNNEEVSRSPLAAAETVADVEAHAWPDPDDYDFSCIAEGVARNDGYRYVTSGFYQPYLHMCDIRGLEQAMMDMVLNPEVLEAIIAHIFAFCYEYNRRSFEAGGVDMMYMSSDLGSQHGPLMSVDHYRRFLMPGHKKMAELAHAHDVKVFVHSDGSNTPFIPILIDEVGIDLLNPIQWRCEGMGREALADLIGDRVVLHGAIDNQQTLPFGTPADVREEVLRTRELFADCRWICAPCHNLQSNTPVENVLAMYEAAGE